MVFNNSDKVCQSLAAGRRGGSRISSQGGCILKNSAEQREAQIFFGVSFEKSRFYAKKSYFFQFQGGGHYPPLHQWFSPGTLISSTNLTDCYEITEIQLEAELNTITLTILTDFNLINRLIYQTSNRLIDMTIQKIRSKVILQDYIEELSKLCQTYDLMSYLKQNCK